MYCLGDAQINMTFTSRVEIADDWLQKKLHDGRVSLLPAAVDKVIGSTNQSYFSSGINISFSFYIILR